MQNNLNNLDTWEKSLGLSSFKLNEDKNNVYIMLNGGSGDFCLDLEGTIENKYNLDSNSWSSSVKNYVNVKKNNIEIYNWSVNEILNADINTVESDFKSFYQYLQYLPKNKEVEFSNFVLKIFNKIRNYESGLNSNLNSLNLLLAILVKGTEYEDQAKSFLNEKESKYPLIFDKFISEYEMGIEHLKPNKSLALIHSLGEIFQIAHLNILHFSTQLDIYGTFSDDIKYGKVKYTSIHYTPNYLARFIVEETFEKFDLSKENIDILDPSCGSGVFLYEAVKYLKKNNYKGEINLFGYDNSEIAIRSAEFILFIEKCKNPKISYKLNIVKSSITNEWSKYDIILMNPPFISWEKLDSDTKESLENLKNDFKIYKPNLSLAFLLKSSQSLKNEGRLGCILPTNSLNSPEYKSLRDKIEINSQFKVVSNMGSSIFPNALVSTSLIILENKTLTYNDSVFDTNIIWTRNKKNIFQEAILEFRKIKRNKSQYNSLDENLYSIFKTDTFPFIESNWKTLSLSETKLIKIINIHLNNNKFEKLENIFDIKQGIRSGNINIFTVDEDFYIKLSKSEKKYYRPEMRSHNLYLNNKIHKKKYIWYPYMNNKLIIETENELLEKAPYTYKYLSIFKNELCKLSTKNINNWWTLTRQRTYFDLKSEARLFSLEFGNNNSYFIDNSGNGIIERGFYYQPRIQLSKEELIIYYTFFSSTIFNKLLSIYSSELQGENIYDLSKRYLKNIPIPKFGNEFLNENMQEKLLDNYKLFSKRKIDNLDFRYLSDEVFNIFF